MTDLSFKLQSGKETNWSAVLFLVRSFQILTVRYNPFSKLTKHFHTYSVF